MNGDNRLYELLNNIPKGIIGVYFFLDQDENILYIGKSIDIRKRVQQHFKSKEKKEIKLQTLTHRITFENCGSELIALLRESELIKQYRPLYNRAQRKVKFFYGITCQADSVGYLSLSVQKMNNEESFIARHSSLREAKEHLFRITEKYHLCQKINDLYKSQTSCFHYSIKQCNGACVHQEPIEQYNVRVLDYLSSLELPREPILIELPGRNSNEKGLVFISEGQYKGFGFCSYRTKKRELMIKKIEPKQDNKDVRKILFRYLRNELKLITI